MLIRLSRCTAICQPAAEDYDRCGSIGSCIHRFNFNCNSILIRNLYYHQHHHHHHYHHQHHHHHHQYHHHQYHHQYHHHQYHHHHHHHHITIDKLEFIINKFHDLKRRNVKLEKNINFYLIWLISPLFFGDINLMR